MPIYVYRCPECDHEEEKLIRWGDIETVEASDLYKFSKWALNGCPECANKNIRVVMKRQVTSPGAFAGLEVNYIKPKGR